MPVIGHALVGFTTAVYAQPSCNRTRNESHTSFDRAPDTGPQYWILALVVLAYLPDIAAQCFQAVGVRDVSRLTHSIGFIVLLTPLAGWLLARLGAARIARSMAIAGFTIGLHVLLDVLQGTDRAILWPLMSRRLSIGVALIPTSLLGEAAFMSAVTLLALAPRLRQWRDCLPRRVHVLPAVAIGLVVVLALTTHTLRDRREKQLRYAKWLIEEQRSYAGGLQVLEGADRWPSAAKPGRVDYLRAEAFAALGDRARAEEHYLKSYGADPSYFWVVADLALFYASGPEPPAARQAAAAPYLARLNKDFSRRRDAPRIAAQVQARLHGN